MAALLAAQPVVAIAAPVAAQAQEESAQQGQPAQDADAPKADDKVEGDVEEKATEPTAKQEPAEEVAPQAKAVEEKPAADESSAAVAKGANDKTYPTVQAAIDANESTVALVANTTENVVIPAGKTVTLDLAGHTLSGGGAQTDKKAALTNNGGTVTITDSSKEKDGVITRDDNGQAGYYVILNSAGEMTIESGTVENNTGSGEAGASLICNGPNSKATLKIAGGKFEHSRIAVKNDEFGILEITAGTINAKNGGQAVQNWNDAIISGGTLTGRVDTWAYMPGNTSTDATTTITGGTVNGDVRSVNYDGKASAPVVNIEPGATVNGVLQTLAPRVTGTPEDYIQTDDNSRAKIAVSGGVFDRAVDERFCADGFAPIENADNTFGVQPAEGNVAFVDGKAYATLKEAVEKASVGSTVRLCKSVVEKVAVSKKLNFVSAEGVDFKGNLQFNKGSEGSTVTGMSFVVDAESENAGVSGSINLSGTSDITIKDSTFSIPSRLWGICGDGEPGAPSWQPNSIFVVGSSDVTVQHNTFNLGRTNEHINTGDVEGDSTVAVNLAGQNTSGIVIDDNTLNVTATANDATNTIASVNFLIANGNENNDPKQFGITDVKVTNNTMTGIAGQYNRFAGVSDVDGLTVTGNMLTNLKYGIGRSSWQNENDAIANVTLGENAYSNIEYLPFAAEEGAFETSGVMVRMSDGTYRDYAKLADAVIAADEGSYIYLLGDNAEDVTIDKKVTVTNIGGAATYTGTMTVTVGATISGLHFVKDTKSIVLKPGTDGAQIMGNTFDVTHNEAVGQANAIYAIDGGVKNLTVVNNTFNAAGVGTVGLNIQNTGVENITLNKNTLNDSYGNASLVNAFGKGDDANYGIQTLTITGNTVNGKYEGNLDSGTQRTNCVSMRNVKGVTFEGNILNKVYTGITWAQWEGYPILGSTGIKVSGNTFTDCLCPVFFRNLLNSGVMDATDLTVSDNTMATSTYSKTAPNAAAMGGQAFAGWYEDAEFKTPAKDDTETAYAKWVPISDVVTFMGNSFRVDNTTANYSNVDMRFGYALDSADGIKSIDSWSWEAGYNGKKVWSDVKGTNRRKPTAQEASKLGIDADATVSNLVVEKIPLPKYGEATFYAQVKVDYTTADGTKASLTDTSRTRTVKDLAERIKEKSQDETEKEIAKGILNTLGVKDNE